MQGAPLDLSVELDRLRMEPTVVPPRSAHSELSEIIRFMFQISGANVTHEIVFPYESGLIFVQI